MGPPPVAVGPLAEAAAAAASLMEALMEPGCPAAADEGPVSSATACTKQTCAGC